MELSKAVGAMAVVLGVTLVGAYALGEDNSPGSAQAAEPQKPVPEVKQADPAPMPKMTRAEREAAQRAVLEEHERLKSYFERHCSKPLKSPAELDNCRVIYRSL